MDVVILDALRRGFPFQLGKYQDDVQHGTTDGGGGVKLLRHGLKLHAVAFQQFPEPAEIRDRPAEPVQTIDENLLDLACLHRLNHSPGIFDVNKLTWFNAEYIRRLVSGVGSHAAELDGYIEKYAQGWKFARIPLVASAIMRVAMYEILYMQDIPDGAAINEAVEIAKHYETPETVRFINGILGSFVRQERQP